MGLRYLGNIIKPGYNPLASNITTGVNTVQDQGIFTLNQQAQALATQQWGTDPYFKNTTLLLQADNATNGLQNNTFLDSSSTGFSVTRNGNATQGTFSPFSQTGWGNYFNGSTDYLSTPDTATLELGSGNFTIEGWVYLNSLPAASGYYAIVGKWVNTAYSYICNMVNTAGVMQLNFSYTTNGSTSTSITVNAPIVARDWQHVAFVRNGSSFKIFLNGIEVTSSATISGTLYDGTAALNIGRNGDATQYLPGYISNLRICKAAVYTANFTPSTTSLTTTSQSASSCVLLTCQNNRFLDSASSLTITANGTPSVQAFGPFAPALQWTPTVAGGSGYFDGTTDYLGITTASSNYYSALGDWTWEAWVYPLSFNGPQYSCPIMASSGDSVLLRAMPTTGASTTLNMYAINAAGSPILGAPGTSAGAIRLNQWSHVVFQRRSGQFDMFLNGTRIANDSTQTTQSLKTADTAFLIGGSGAGTSPYWNGYISGVRVQNGTSAYPNTTYTIPTAPPSPTGAAICVNFTNAGIYDASAKNVLETVGNAQVSTSVVKYGSGSLYFDGSTDYLTCTSVNNALLTGDFTLEFWINGTYSGTKVLVDWASTPQLYMSGTSLIWFWTSARITGSLVSNTWQHVAIVRAAGVTKMYIDGIANATAWADTSSITTQTVTIGGRAIDTTNTLNGYMDEVRITKGLARYLRNFTPPQSALPRQ